MTGRHTRRLVTHITAIMWPVRQRDLFAPIVTVVWNRIPEFLRSNSTIISSPNRTLHQPLHRTPQKKRKHTIFPEMKLTSRMLFGMRRSEEHTSELQSRPHLVCRLLL